MKNLQTKIDKMISGERKRRDIALKWLDDLTKRLSPLCLKLLGSNEINSFEFDYVIRFQNIYFRYNSIYNDYRQYTDYEGFYFISINGYIKFTDSVKDIKGDRFWEAIKEINKNIPVLIDTLQKQNNKKDTLIQELEKLCLQ